ncbi:N-acetylmuramoyl-L-alanine amidase [Bacillus mojavensis]|uniref:N-acetylmuramoyl-L-alanine amidase n=1 Tax=Bacillus mojavensis TaxID=72360 RepID=A0ABX6M0F0_BACMO|nr:N-acetylmuramoyl-L-alanine amidase [Bacillus mojavensis]
MRKGADVTKIQKALADLYFYPDKGAKNNGIDGVYGPKTANAVKRFQSVNGLTPDGIYGLRLKQK